MTVYASDTFVDADGTALSAHTPNSGGNYSETNPADAYIHSNQATNVTFGADVCVSPAAPASADYQVTMDINFASGTTGTMQLLLRWDNSGGGTGYRAGWSSGSGWAITEQTAGAGTDLVTSATPSISPPQVNTVIFAISGTSLTLTIDGTLVLSVTDSTHSAINNGGFLLNTFIAEDMLFDNFELADIGGGGSPGVHIVTGRGNFSISSPTCIETDLAGVPFVSSGNAEPENLFHVGMISWGTANGAMKAYPITRAQDLVEIPAGMDTLWYEFDPAITATITERSAP